MSASLPSSGLLYVAALEDESWRALTFKRLLILELSTGRRESTANRIANSFCSAGTNEGIAISVNRTNGTSHAPRSPGTPKPTPRLAVTFTEYSSNINPGGRSRSASEEEQKI